MKVEINEIDARSEVTKLLNDFDVDYCSDDISQLREKYPGYVAMYTKFIFNPEIAIRLNEAEQFNLRNFEDVLICK